MSKYLLLLLLCGAAFASMDAKPSRDRNRKDWRLVCYLGSWANYRPQFGKFVIEDIDAHLCTHLIFGFAKLEHDRITVFDPYLDLEENWGLAAYKRFNALRHRNSELTTLIAIGGWNEGSLKYSDMARDPGRRRVFVSSVLDFLQRYDFDGLDFDWEYPANREGSRPDDKDNFVQVLKELKEAFTPHGYLLTSAVSPGKSTIETAYDIPQVAKYLDFVNLMTYDYHGAWDNFTGVNSPLYSRADEKGDQQLLNVNFSVHYWISHGTPPQKLVMGMPLYGRCLELVDQARNGLGDPVRGPGLPGPYTREPGMMGYNEICSAQRQEVGQWKVTWNEEHRAPYASKGKQWCGYDDVKSIGHKVDYLKSMGLGGGMVWSIDTDDFRGHCWGIPYPLLRVIHSKLSGSDWTPPPTTGPIVTWTEPGNRCKSEGNFGYPGVCDRYYQCVQVQPGVFRLVDRNCPPGTSFDAVKRLCLHSSLVSTCGQSASTITTTSGPTVIHTTTSSRTTTTGTNKPPTVVHTTTSSSSTTTRRTTPPSGEFVCTEAGLFPHPSDCSKFVKCTKSKDGQFRSVVFLCPAGLVFNVQSSTCDYPKNVPRCQ